VWLLLNSTRQPIVTGVGDIRRQSSDTDIVLCCSLELVRLCHSQHVSSDMYITAMSCDGTVAAKPRTINLNEELGQIRFILSDKTGTLTQVPHMFLASTAEAQCFHCFPLSVLLTSDCPFHANVDPSVGWASQFHHSYDFIPCTYLCILCFFISVGLCLVAAWIVQPKRLCF